MKQILQSLDQGTTTLLEAPAPKVTHHHLLIHTNVSLISAGTERMLVDFSKASYLKKARQQPEKVKMVLEKIKTDGLFATVDAVRSKLAEPLPLGYCHVGVVADVGSGCDDFHIGARVVSNGAHADLVHVAKHCCAKIPDEVDDEQAVFTVAASIGLQGIRLVQPTLGEAVVVTGVGLIGLLTVQLLRAQGCRVLAIDFDDRRLALAQQFGADVCNPAAGQDPIAMGMRFSRGRGVDAVIITASTQSNDPVKQAARMSRKRGRIVLVGVTGLELNRADFYEKELTFQVSCSYGPGRYDSAYEEKGHDYPIGFVRWTQQRNFEACLDMMARGQLEVKSLITHRYLFEEAERAYHALTNDKSALGILLQYTSDLNVRKVRSIPLNNNSHYDASKPILSFIGGGNYAARKLIPAFKMAGAQLHTLVTSGGLRSAVEGKKFGFHNASTDLDEVLANKEMNTLVIVTRHDTHASIAVKALAAGKHVFVEKPLAIHLADLAAIETAFYTAHAADKKLHLMVGFNRRFSPHVQKMKALLATIAEPKSFILTINAGAIPDSHWTQDKMIGGGRIIGEACHFIDLMCFLAGSDVISMQARRMGNTPTMAIYEDKATITLGFADGSFGTIHYFANGANNFPKERIEVFTSGRILQLDNFRSLKGFGWPGFKKMNLWRQDKGQFHCANAFLKSIALGTETPIAASDIFAVSRLSIEAAEMLGCQE